MKNKAGQSAPPLAGRVSVAPGGGLYWPRLALYALALLALSFALAYQRTWLLDYNPVNGDFQSYNVFRRLLDGQRPYADFANYVGMAPILINLPLLLVNGSFAGSLFATHFTCNLLFSLCVLLVFWLITENGPLAMLVSAGFTKLVSSGLLGLFGGAGAYLNGLYTNLYTPSNSMRIARIFWPFLLVLAFLVFNRVYHRRTGRHYNLMRAPLSGRFCAVWGALAGLGLTWSSDFGLAVAFASLLLFVLLLARLKPGAKRFAGHLLVFAGALLAGGVLSATLATGGQPLAWLNATLSVGEWQYFYFNGASGRALLTVIFTNPRLLACTAPYLAFLAVCLVRLIRGRLDNRWLLGGFLALCVLAGTYAYIVAGSGYNFTEALEGFLWLGLAAGVLRACLRLGRRYARQIGLAAAGLLAVLAVGFSALAVRDVAQRQTTPREGHYVQALGGWVNYPLALDGAAQLTAGQDVFSVYATGLEVVKGQFQPSGYDYIIHALGDEARADYLQSFTKGNWPWAQTMALELERWLAVENWDFYRLLAEGYTREERTEYSWLWQRADASQALDIEAGLTLTQREDGRWQIDILAPAGSNFTADVVVRYTTSFTSAGGAALSLGRRCVAASLPDPVGDGENVWGYFAAEDDALYLPIAVRNGQGSAVLLGCDAAHVALHISSAELVAALPDLRVP